MQEILLDFISSRRLNMFIFYTEKQGQYRFSSVSQRGSLPWRVMTFMYTLLWESIETNWMFLTWEWNATSVSTPLFPLLKAIGHNFIDL